MKAVVFDSNFLKAWSLPLASAFLMAEAFWEEGTTPICLDRFPIALCPAFSLKEER